MTPHDQIKILRELEDARIALGRFKTWAAASILVFALCAFGITVAAVDADLTGHERASILIPAILFGIISTISSIGCVIAVHESADLVRQAQRDYEDTFTS